MLKRSLYVFFAAAVFFAAPVLAHESSAHASGFLAGFVHPLGGIDHMLAMLVAGLYAASRNRGGHAAIVPLVFMVTMLAGFLTGAVGVFSAWAEPGILVTMLLLPVLLLVGLKPWYLPALFVLATAGLFHGQAHGLEAQGQTVWFAAGFLGCSVMLQFAGFKAGRYLRQRDYGYGLTAATVFGLAMVLVLA